MKAIILLIAAAAVSTAVLADGPHEGESSTSLLYRKLTTVREKYHAMVQQERAQALLADAFGDKASKESKEHKETKEAKPKKEHTREHHHSSESHHDTEFPYCASCHYFVNTIESLVISHALTTVEEVAKCFQYICGTDRNTPVCRRITTDVIFYAAKFIIEEGFPPGEASDYICAGACHLCRGEHSAAEYAVASPTYKMSDKALSLMQKVVTPKLAYAASGKHHRKHHDSHSSDSSSSSDDGDLVCDACRFAVRETREAFIAGAVTTAVDVSRLWQAVCPIGVGTPFCLAVVEDGGIVLADIFLKSCHEQYYDWYVCHSAKACKSHHL